MECTLQTALLDISTHTSLSEPAEWWRYPWHCLQGSVEQTISTCNSINLYWPQDLALSAMNPIMHLWYINWLIVTHMEHYFQCYNFPEEVR